MAEETKDKHSVFSPSSSKRWLNCTASVALCEQMGCEEEASVYAQEGTNAHFLGERMLNYYLDKGQRVTDAMRFNGLIEVSEEDLDAWYPVKEYVDYVLDIYEELKLKRPYDTFIFVEEPVDFSNLVPNGFGKSDVIIISGDVLHCIDYKHGRGVEVSAKENPQAMLYGLGALNGYDMLYDITRVHLHIVQPRIGNISVWDLGTKELRAFGEVVKERATRILAGNTVYYPSADTCKFCKARALCRARASKYIEELEKYTKRG